MINTLFNKTLLGVLAVVAVCGVVFFYNPSQVQWMPKCMLYVLTGYKCPTCGATRAAHHMMHGHVREALMLNPLMPVLLGLAAVIIYRYIFKKDTDHTTTRVLVYAYIAVYCVWGIARNIIGI